MTDSQQIRKESEEYYAKEKWILFGRELLNYVGFPADVLLSFKDAREKAILYETIEFLKANDKQLRLEQLKQLGDIDVIKYQLKEIFDNYAAIKSDFINLLKSKNYFPKFVTPLQKYFSDNLSPKDPHKFLFDNNLLYFPDNEQNLINEIEFRFLGKRNKYFLISGNPETGKTILGFQIGFDFLSKGKTVYYFRFFSGLDISLLWQDLLILNASENVLVIADNCHIDFGNAAFICQNYDKISNLNILFLSRPSSKETLPVSEYDNVSFNDYFEGSHFYLTSNEFEDKASGIIDKYKAFYENRYEVKLEIGNKQFVINNSHQNLITLYYNLEFWEPSVRLDKLEDKNKIFRKLYTKYLENEHSEKLILLAVLYKYEIYYEAKDDEVKDLDKLSLNGVVRKHPQSNYYYLYHSSFAKLLLNAFTVHSSFQRYKSLEHFCYSKIKTHILSFKDYPLNLVSIFHNLINNHALNTAVNLLKNDLLFQKFIKYFLNYGHSLTLLFILYRIHKKNYHLANKIFESIPSSTWANNFRNLTIAGISVGLLKMNSVAHKKAEEVLAEFKIEELIDFTRKTKFNLLANSLRELDKISGQLNIGSKIYSSLSTKELLKKIYESSLAHIGKGLSELFFVNKKRTLDIFYQVDKELLINKINASDIKYISKTLNELNRFDKNFISEIFTNLNNDILISKLKLIDIEGIGRSLNEFGNINLEKTKEIFHQLDDQFFADLFKNTSLTQIAHSLSEMHSIDEQKIERIFYLLDTHIILNKIHNKNTTLQKLGNALSIFRKVDKSKTKTREILKGIESQNFVRKASSISFNNICLGIVEIGVIDKELALNILVGIDKKSFLQKVQSESFQNLGRALNKLKKFDKKYSIYIASQVNWQDVISKSDNISFAQLANCLADLRRFDKKLSGNIYRSMYINWLVTKARKSQTSIIKDSLRKLRNVDEKTSREIFNQLFAN